MPIYEYIHTETGSKVELVRSLKDRDKPVSLKFIRKKIPKSIAVVGTASNPVDLQAGVFKGYYKNECNGTFKSAFTKKQIKQAWSQPLPA